MLLLIKITTFIGFFRKQYFVKISYIWLEKSTHSYKSFYSYFRGFNILL